jgi:hypothetical protein
MAKTIDVKHKEGLCTVIGCEKQGFVRIVMVANGMSFIECLCGEHYTQYIENREPLCS